MDEYLSKIDFYNYWTKGFDRNTFTPTKIITNLCLWKLNPSMISPYVLKAQQYFENNFNTTKSFEPLNISLAELFNNITDHSNSLVSGYCISQYYPNIDKIKIAVCDFGYGIPKSVNQYLQKINQQKISETDAIIKAIKKSFSTKSQPHNRGFGLDTIKTIVLESNGELRIVSNGAAYELKNKTEKTYPLPSSFNGTQIEIVLDSSTFSEKEEHFIDEDFTF